MIASPPKNPSETKSRLGQYKWARWYDSQAGRWISEDPLGFAAGDSNLARYVGNGSVNSGDPSGYFKFGGQEYVWPWHPQAQGFVDTVTAYGSSTVQIGAGTATGAASGAATGAATGAAVGGTAGGIAGGPVGIGPGMGAGFAAGGVGGGLWGGITGAFNSAFISDDLKDAAIGSAKAGASTGVFVGPFGAVKAAKAGYAAKAAVTAAAAKEAAGKALGNLIAEVAASSATAAQKVSSLENGANAIASNVGGITFIKLPSAPKGVAAIFKGAQISTGKYAGATPVLAVKNSGQVVKGLTVPHPFDKNCGYIVDVSKLLPIP